MQTTEETRRAERERLVTDIAALLKQHGPLEPADIAKRLCVASRNRLNAAFGAGRRLGLLERAGRCTGAYRIKGDRRLLGVGSLDRLYARKREARPEPRRRADYIMDFES